MFTHNIPIEFICLTSLEWAKGLVTRPLGNGELAFEIETEATGNTPAQVYLLRGDGETIPNDAANTKKLRIQLSQQDVFTIGTTSYTLKEILEYLKDNKLDKKPNGTTALITTGGKIDDSYIPNIASAKITGILQLANGGTGANGTSIAAKRVFAAPATGTGAAAFRELTADDIPNIPPGKINGTLSDGQIPNLSAQKITEGELNAARLPSIPPEKLTDIPVSKITGVLPLAKGGTGVGDLLANDVIKPTYLPAADLAGIKITGILPKDKGGTGVDGTNISSGGVFIAPAGGAAVFRELAATDIPPIGQAKVDGLITDLALKAPKKAPVLIIDEAAGDPNNAQFENIVPVDTGANKVPTAPSAFAYDLKYKKQIANATDLKYVFDVLKSTTLDNYLQTGRDLEEGAAALIMCGRDAEYPMELIELGNAWQEPPVTQGQWRELYDAVMTTTGDIVAVCGGDVDPSAYYRQEEIFFGRETGHPPEAMVYGYSCCSSEGGGGSGFAGAEWED